MNDSIITKVRSIREQHVASMGYDLDRVYADLKARQEKHMREGWVIVPPPSCPPPEHNLALQKTRFLVADGKREVTTAIKAVTK